MRDLAGRTAFVTGGASGIGLGMAGALAEAGMNLVLADVAEDALAKACEGLAAAGASVLAVPLDVTDRKGWEEAAGKAESRFGGVDVLCNNAGIVAMGWNVEDIAPDLWDLAVNINLNGMFNGARTLIPRMKRQGRGGHIVNTGSVSSLRGRAHHAVYVATKHAVLGFSESLALELAEHRIGVSILCPGHVNTNLNASSHLRRSGITAELSPLGADTGMTGPESLDPAEVGRMVREAIETEQFYILTHPQYRPIVESRHEELMRAFDYWSAHQPAGGR